MRYDPIRHTRRSIRLKGYDYTQAGAYFVTIVTRNRECLFGEVADGDTRLNESGQIAAACWQDITRHFGNVALDEFVVMPNHIHGVILIADASSTVGAKHSRQPRRIQTETDIVFGIGSANANHGMLRPYKNTLPPRGTKTNSLGAILQNFKSVSTRKVNQTRETQGAPLWQRNYWEHIVRNEEDLDRIREYIIDNPLNWQSDENNPQNVR